jgi:hypothetical protein
VFHMPALMENWFETNVHFIEENGKKRHKGPLYNLVICLNSGRHDR